MTRPWETLASEPTKDGDLALLCRGGKDYLITIGGRVLMTSAAHRSEDELAKLACERLAKADKPRVLISGLGMGFTLRAALTHLPKNARVDVAELNAVVLKWCQGPLGPLTKHAANDPRVHNQVADVAKVLRQASKHDDGARYDAIVLDMYEGPQSHIHLNDTLYGTRAVVNARDALAPEGVFAVWCEGVSTGFERSLKYAGFTFELVRVGRGASTHHVYMARMPEKKAARESRSGTRPVRAPRDENSADVKREGKASTRPSTKAKRRPTQAASGAKAPRSSGGGSAPKSKKPWPKKTSR